MRGASQGDNGSAEHWFDALTKRVASGGVSRRWAILGVGAVAAAAAMSGGVGPSLAQQHYRPRRKGQAPQPPGAPPTDGPCVRRMIGGRTLETRVAGREGISLRKDLSFDRATGTTAAVLTFSRGQSTIARLQIQRDRSGAITSTTTYGTEVKGPRTFSWTSPDGRNFRATIDGRPIDSQRGFRRGGEVGPEITLDPALRQSLLDLASELRKPTSGCRTEIPPEQSPPPARPAPRPPAEKGRFRRAVPGQSGAFRRAAFNWYVPAAQNSPACTRCHDRCSDDYADCVFDPDKLLDWISAIGAPVTVFTRIGPCLAACAACNANCYLPEQGCCPVSCGGLTESCCGNGATCMLPAQRTCCPPGQVVCRGTCCEQGVVGCAKDGFCGCPKDQEPCGDACCEERQMCCGGACCAPGRCQNGICGDSPQRARCGNVICAPLDNCCGGRCCTGTCVNNQCCPPARGCGPSCCAPGQNCVDPVKGICQAARIRCRGFSSPCRTQLPTGQYTEICCPNGTQCCGGRCCPRGQQCCFRGGREVGCCISGGVN
jgi:hypothetical protein